MIQLFGRLRPYVWPLALTVALIVSQSVANLYLPDLNARIVNEGVAIGDSGFILRAGGIMLAVTALISVCSIAAAYFGARVSSAFARDLRGEVFRKVTSFSQHEVDRFGTPSLITRSTNDAQQIQSFIQMALSMMIMAPINLVGGVVMALRQDVPLTGVVAAVIPLMALFAVYAFKTVMPLFASMQDKLDALNRVMREKLEGVRVIRAFVRVAHEQERFRAANDDLTGTALKASRRMSFLFPASGLLMNLTTLALVWFAGSRIEAGMPIGNMTALITYVMQILMSVMFAVMMFAMIPRAVASANRINEVLTTEPSIVDPPIPKALSRGGKELAFENVSFTYPDAEEAVLKDISFSARPGEVLAVIGSTGCGKSTVVNLLPRFFDVTGGSIKLGGTDIRELTRDDLCSRIGFVPQQALLFSGTIAENLRFGKADATDEELWQALKVAQAEDFVKELDQGLGADVAQGGTNFSGGQRQRLAIARALVRRPAVYVFDDSFSALDSKTDAALRAALAKETADAVVVIVAQRISTIMRADRIVVLEDGVIAGTGTHKELMAGCEIYREIARSQMQEDAA